MHKLNLLPKKFFVSLESWTEKMGNATAAVRMFARAAGCRLASRGRGPDRIKSTTTLAVEEGEGEGEAEGEGDTDPHKEYIIRIPKNCYRSLQSGCQRLLPADMVPTARRCRGSDCWRPSSIFIPLLHNARVTVHAVLHGTHIAAVDHICCLGDCYVASFCCGTSRARADR